MHYIPIKHSNICVYRTYMQSYALQLTMRGSNTHNNSPCCVEASEPVAYVLWCMLSVFMILIPSIYVNRYGTRLRSSRPCHICGDKYRAYGLSKPKLGLIVIGKRSGRILGSLVSSTMSREQVSGVSQRLRTSGGPEVTLQSLVELLQMWVFRDLIVPLAFKGIFL